MLKTNTVLSLGTLQKRYRDSPSSLDSEPYDFDQHGPNWSFRIVHADRMMRYRPRIGDETGRGPLTIEPDYFDFSDWHSSCTWIWRDHFLRPNQWSVDFDIFYDLWSSSWLFYYNTIFFLTWNRRNRVIITVINPFMVINRFKLVLKCHHLVINPC